MIKPKKIIQILSAVAVLAILWIAFILIQGLFARNISQHQKYIPENAESVLEINGELLIHAFVRDILSEGKLDDKLKEYMTPSESSEALGIDYLSKVYVFTIKKESNLLTGILVNVLDEDQFKRAMEIDRAKGTSFAVKSGVGLMLFDSSEHPMDQEKMNISASDLIQKQAGFDLSQLPMSKNESKIRYWRKNYSIGDEGKSLNNISMTLFIEKNELKMKGTAEFETSMNRVYPVLKKSDLSIQTQFIPNSVNRIIQDNLKTLGFMFPKMTYVSGNYHYSEPSPIPDLKVLPHFDGIYSFEENFQFRLALIAVAASGKINSLTLKSFQLGDKVIYYEQIDPKTIYLGQSKYNPESVEKNALFEVNGDLKQLLEIRNGGMISRLLSLSPEYNAAERFLSGIKSSDFYMRDRDGETVDLSAEITFEEGKSAFNEMIRLVLGLGLMDAAR